MSNDQQSWEPLFRPALIAPGSADKSKDRPPRAFVSYALESDLHTIWVRRLADRLYGHGVQVILDQWDLPPGSAQFSFMERNIENCDFVIVICTPTYAEKANNREGGVGYESMVIAGALASQIESRKFIPVLRSGDWKSSLPIYLRSKHGVDLSNDPYLETQYEQLIRALHCEPVQPPPVGSKPAFSNRTRVPAASSGLVEPPKPGIRDTQPNYVAWADSDPGPLVDIVVMNSPDVLEAWRAAGLECPPPVRMKALLDTGSAVTIISKTFARHCKLLQTGESDIRALGALHKCGEHAGTIVFAGTNLRPAEAIRIRSGDFIREPHFACLIGRDIMRHWKITFDGPSKCVTIVD